MSPSWTQKFVRRLDVGPIQDPIHQTRLRGIQVANGMLAVVAVPWVVYCIYLGLIPLAVAIACGLMFVPLTIGLARRGRVQLAVHHFMVWLLLGIAVGIWQRGGLQYSVSSWLACVPVLSFLFLGLRGGMFWTAATAACAVAFFVGQRQGWIVSSPIGEGQADTLVLLDYICLPATIAGAMWSHMAGQDSVVTALDQGNEMLRAQVAERKRAEELAQEAIRARDEFVATMSHEVRTPLNGVLGLSELLSTTELNSEQRELAKMVHDSGHLLRRLLDDVLDYSKIDGEQLVLEARPFHLETVCDQLAGREGAAMGERGVKMRLDLHADCPDWVLGDSVRLCQVLGNLISNAAKFTPAGSVMLRVFGHPGGLSFEVEDTGIGMNPQEMARVFEPFAQADSSTTRRFGGTGLGLTISSGIVQNMGGEISVRSTPGVGTVFQVRLPLLACEPPVSKDRDSVQVLRLDDVLVLVAEDNVVNRVVISRFLQEMGARVVLVADGKACLEAWQAQAPDLILMDCQMPLMDGYQAAAAIRAQGGELPIIALTANTSVKDRERSIASGMNDHLGKPLSIEQLSACLAHWLPEAVLQAEGLSPLR
ncbi:MAG: signal transduction histidine kinase/ActR/RegA family two-component response regulator [Cognaticolwellia sp.]|jgi:signal transduction histidine kinase/ActR/RegA family two-component response regulator